MADGKFPRPYVNSVPREGSDPMMEYTNLDKLDIGARKSGMPNSASDGPKGLEHVGGSAGRK